MGLFALLVRISLPYPLSFGIPLVLLLLYGTFLGTPVTVFRAVAMFAVLAGGRILGRSYDLLSAWALSGILLLVDNPDILFHSGFQLSFGAVAGIAYVQAVMQNSMEREPKGKGKTGRKRVKNWINGIFTRLIEGVHLWIFLLPVVLYTYYQVSMAGLICNVIVIPLLPAVLLSGLSALLVSGISVFGGSILGTAAYGILKFCEWLGDLADRSPYGIWTPGQPEIWQIVLYYFLLLAGAGLDRQMGRLPVWLRSVGNWTLRLALVLFLGVSFGPSVKVTALDVGQGDGVVLQSHGTVLLVDGGSSSRSHVGERVLLPFLKQQGIAHINGILLTHTDEDHVNGIGEVLSEARRGWLTIDALYMPAWMLEDEKSASLCQLAVEADIMIESLEQKDCLTSGDMKLTVLYPTGDFRPDDPNDGSLSLYWQGDGLCGILTGDLRAEGELAMIEELDEWMDLVLEDGCDFLKVGHHGSATSSCQSFLEWANPQAALISCGVNNRYGHPAEEVLERLKTVTDQIYRTDQMGAVTLYATK